MAVMKLKMNLYSLLRLPVLLNVVFSTIADLRYSHDEVPATLFQSRLPKERHLIPSKANFNEADRRRLKKESHFTMPQWKTTSAYPMHVESQFRAVEYVTLNYSTPTHFTGLGPKNGYRHNTVAYFFTMLPITPMVYSTTTRARTAPMTHSAPTPAHVTLTYDVDTPLRYTTFQSSTYPTTTPRTA